MLRIDSTKLIESSYVNIDGVMYRVDHTASPDDETDQHALTNPEDNNERHVDKEELFNLIEYYKLVKH